MFPLLYVAAASFSDVVDKNKNWGGYIPCVIDTACEGEYLRSKIMVDREVLLNSYDTMRGRAEDFPQLVKPPPSSKVPCRFEKEKLREVPTEESTKLA